MTCPCVFKISFIYVMSFLNYDTIIVFDMSMHHDTHSCKYWLQSESAALQLAANCLAAACFSIGLQSCATLQLQIPASRRTWAFLISKWRPWPGPATSWQALGAWWGPRWTSDSSRQVTHCSSAWHHGIIPHRAVFNTNTCSTVVRAGAQYAWDHGFKSCSYAYFFKMFCTCVYLFVPLYAHVNQVYNCM